MSMEGHSLDLSKLSINMTWLKVRNRTRIKFWKDSWWGDQPLCFQFPVLYRLVQAKKILSFQFFD